MRDHPLLAPRGDLNDATEARPGRRNWVVIVGLAAMAAGVLLVQALLHRHFSAIDEYDDGVYFGASVELVHGVLAYRDFAFIQPPLITVWMLPFAAASRVMGTALAMESARFFVDLVTVANVALVGALVRHRCTLQVAAATGVMAFSQGTIRASQTILLEPFLVLACLLAFLCLLDGETFTTSPRRLWWCGLFLGVGGATKIWAVFPLAAVLIVARPAGSFARRRIAGGAVVGFGACCLPFLASAPYSFFTQVVLTQARRDGGGLPLLPRLADMTGVPGLTWLVSTHTGIGVGLLFVVGAGLLAATLVRHQSSRTRPPRTPLERLAGWSALIVGAGLVISPTYYYHYAGFLAPFGALVVSTLVVPVRARLDGGPSLRRRVGLLAVIGVPSTLAAMASGSVDEIVTLPAAPHVGDVVSDAIPRQGCVLYSNPTLALLDDRFTSDVSGCPDVIDWLGQERVLDNGQAVAGSDRANRRLQGVMGRWIKSSDAVVLNKSNLGLNEANVNYLTKHFDRQRHEPRGLRIYVRPPDGRDGPDPL